jgi:AraC-like DNA-binding protein
MGEPRPPTSAEIDAVIDAIERAVAGRLCFFDPGRLLAAAVAARRTYHQDPFCRHFSRSGQRCGQFDNLAVMAELRRRGRGFFKRCHAGVVEYVAPLLGDGRIVGAILAGPWRVSGGLPAQTLLDKEQTVLDGSAKELRQGLAEADFERLHDAAALVECLVARLAPLLDGTAIAEGEVNRRWQIDSLVGRRFMAELGVAEVARHLGVSPSRARHLVRELFGTTVAELVRRQRIAHAKHLLARSEIPIGEVASRCGFPDAGYFHRVFKRAVGVTPSAYRDSPAASEPA